MILCLNDQYYNFYRSLIETICQNIKNGKVSIIVGINSIGKTFLVSQLKSERFKAEFGKHLNTKFVFLEFKDKVPPTAEQLYKCWLTESAKILKYNLPKNEKYNDFSYYFHLTSMMKNLKTDERIAFVVLDAQNILNQQEGFFKSLIYLHRFTYGKATYVFLSEPQIMDHPNKWVTRFVQDLTHFNFFFLDLFDKKTIQIDIKREEEFLKTNLTEKQNTLITKYCGGLHGVIGALSYFLKNNPEIKNFGQLKKIVFEDEMCRYWVEETLGTLPLKSIKILKETAINRESFIKSRNDIYGLWLIKLGFLKKNGKLRHPLLLPYINSYVISESTGENNLIIKNGEFQFKNQQIILSWKEKSALSLLFRSKGNTVSYDDLGKVIWKNNPDKYSLWAISQIIRRLRKKLLYHSINPKIIKSVRGEGYSLN